MIISDLQNWEFEKIAFHTALHKGIEYIKNTDFNVLKPGKYEIQGKEIYAQVQEVETKPIAETEPESHLRYIDVHYLVKGSEEIIGISKVNPKNPISIDNLETRDIAFYQSVENESFIKLKGDMFAIFFPQDIHRPCCHLGNEELIKKVVIKIDSHLLDDKQLVE
jgi:YhcH/YjgK/YiaL family protein